MKMYALNPEALKEQYLKVDHEAAACPWPKEFTLIFSFFQNCILMDDVTLEDLGDGYLSKAELKATIQSMVDKNILSDVCSSDSSKAFTQEVKETWKAVAMLGSLARATHLLAADIAAMGNEALHDDFHKELEDLYKKLTGKLEQLQTKRQGYVEKQLQKLNISKNTCGLKLHYGVPGLRKLEGWINIEPVPAELALNMTWPLPFDSGTVDYVYSAHTIEHIHYKSEVLKFLKEIYRALRPGGAMRIVTPDIEVLLKAYFEPQQDLFNYRQKLKHYYFTALYQSPLEHVLRYSGTGVRPWDFFTHKYGYDFATMKNLLTEVGFKKIRKCSYMGSEFDTLKIDDQCSGAQQGYKDTAFSLFVEAVKG